MSASLVGSEMCIRDSQLPMHELQHKCRWRLNRARREGASGGAPWQHRSTAAQWGAPVPR
eukprot:2422826-Alexandrium_andersonii.AAC.1